LAHVVSQSIEATAVPFVNCYGWIVVGRISRHRLDDGLPHREGLCSEFAVKAAYVGLIAFKIGATCPDSPIMHISTPLEAVVAHSVYGRRWDV